jgi:hypothetical protein
VNACQVGCEDGGASSSLSRRSYTFLRNQTAFSAWFKNVPWFWCGGRVTASSERLEAGDMTIVCSESEVAGGKQPGMRCTNPTDDAAMVCRQLQLHFVE